MCVKPCRLSVTAVARMMKYITIFEKNAPTPTSTFRKSSSSTVAPLRRARVLCPSAFSSSTSSLVCQKNRYGLIVVPRIATSVDHSSLLCGIDGTKVSRSTLPQSAPTTNAVMGYAKSTSTSHFSTFAICLYWSLTVAQEIRTANTTTNQWELMPDSIAAASAMPARSAPILIVLAARSATTNTSRIHFGNRFLKFAARPCPVTLPMRAHII